MNAILARSDILPGLVGLLAGVGVFLLGMAVSELLVAASQRAWLRLSPDAAYRARIGRALALVRPPAERHQRRCR